VLTDELRQAMQAFPAVELTAKPIHEEDWAVSWREFFGVVDTGKIVIVPSWIDHDVKAGEPAILLDPGQAFGTGHHETTRLCLQALPELVTRGMRGRWMWDWIRLASDRRSEARGRPRGRHRH
jgi:ribosomal protein L11 methyltransferase